MDYEILGTGSSGNAVILNHRIMIDCGLPYKRISSYASDLALVLLTHVHGDHFRPSTVRALHRERPSVRWGCCEWMAKPLLDAGVDSRAIDVLTPDKLHGYAMYGGGDEPSQMLIQASVIPHNVENCCYRLKIGGERIFYATDCSTLDGISAEGYDLYLIEANHTNEDIAARIAAKESAGKYAYEIEAARNHLSREQAEEWLAENARANSRYVFLHQHQHKEKEASPCLFT